VARDYRRHRVFSDGVRDGADGRGPPDAPRQLGIAYRRAARNIRQLAPDLFLEISAMQFAEIYFLHFHFFARPCGRFWNFISPAFAKALADTRFFNARTSCLLEKSMVRR
jgi:hypothetical protein